MNSSFERTATGKNEWLTPPYILNALGPFDLDPCAPISPPWKMAENYYTIQDDGLVQSWKGKVWCNPPYGNNTKEWLKKCASHNNCIVLTFARTETKMFFEYVWTKAYAVFFIKGRLKFHHVDGKQGGTAGAPSVLIAYGVDNAVTLKNCNLNGKFVSLIS